jgi:hypothetical protein
LVASVGGFIFLLISYLHLIFASTLASSATNTISPALSSSPTAAGKRPGRFYRAE